MRRRGSNRKREEMLVTALIAVIALVAGFVLGRVTAGVGITSMEVVSTSDTIEASEDIAAADVSSEDAAEEGSEVASEETAAGTETGDAAEVSSDEDTDTASTASDTDTGELVDAADVIYGDGSEESDASDSSEQITHEAVTDVPTEITTVDVTTIEDVTQTEDTLPDGVVSTLYGKTGEALFQIVVFGDSQFGNFVGEDGMAYLLSQKLHANVYNLAMGGKTASVDPEEQGNADVNTWEETCGVSMVKAVCGLADADAVFAGWDYQLNVFNSCDFSLTDVFVIEFGVNDYLSEREMHNSDNPNNYFSYYGALDTMVWDLRTYYPDAQIVICGPGYAQFWESGTGAFLGDSNVVSNYYGTVRNYGETAGNILDGEFQNLSFANIYDYSGINNYTAPEDLLDGIHYTASGRVKYVNYLSRVILRSQGYTIDEGVDPDTVDWISQKSGANTWRDQLWTGRKG